MAAVSQAQIVSRLCSAQRLELILTFLEGPNGRPIYFPGDTLRIPVNSIVVCLDDAGTRGEIFDVAKDAPKRLCIFRARRVDVCLPMVRVSSQELYIYLIVFVGYIMLSFVRK